MRRVLGIDAGGTKTVALLADETGRILRLARGGGANLRTHGELGVEKVLHQAIEEAQGEARADALALGMAGADRPDDDVVLRGILRRLGFSQRVVVTNDARIALCAGSPSRVGLAVVCGTGSIAWGRNARGEIARAGGWGWHLGDEGSAYWMGMQAIQRALRASDGRGEPTRLERALTEHFEITKAEQILRAVYDGEFPRSRVSGFAPRVGEAALAGDGTAREILSAAADELALAGQTVRDRLLLAEGAYDVILTGGTFAAVPALAAEVATRLAAPGARVELLKEEPAAGAVRLAIEALPRKGGDEPRPC
jgi:N-acetylglucosamine kinase